jgi:hypothetical protein
LSVATALRGVRFGHDVLFEKFALVAVFVRDGESVSHLSAERGRARSQGGS